METPVKTEPTTRETTAPFDRGTNISHIYIYTIGYELDWPVVKNKLTGSPT